MPLLDEILKKDIRLIDYECIVENGVRGNNRLVAFGRYAGLAGMIDTFSGLGQRLLALGYGTPFLNISQTFMYQDYENAVKSIKQAGEVLALEGTPTDLGPLTFVFTGEGNVSNGALEVFKHMPHEV